MKNPFITVHNISKTYKNDTQEIRAINNISIEFYSGELALIMGPSGSGKTTLMAMMGTLLIPDKGSVYYSDTDIYSLDDHQLSFVRSRYMGFVFQSFHLINSLSVIDNVALAAQLAGETKTLANELAEQYLSYVGIADTKERRISELSGGQKQRVAIARALVTKPNVLFADEPTANLDSHAGHSIGELLHTIARELDTSVIIVTHDQRLLNIADKVLHIEDGEMLHNK